MLMKKILLVLFCASLLSRSAGSASCAYNDLEASDRWQQIQSPEYPQPFPAQTQCSWRITAPQGFRIKLQFSGFWLVEQNPEGKCNSQWLNIMFRDKVADTPGKFYAICGTNNPGTIVSTGGILRLNLQSGSGAAGQRYSGFQASYSKTNESPILPSQLRVAEQESGSAGPTQETLGSVLNRLRPNAGTVTKPKSQSKRIEELNRRRNQGLPVRENPHFLPDGQVANPIEGRTTTRRPVYNTTTKKPFVYRPPPKRSKPLSNEIKTVIIVIAIIVVFFIVILVMRKFGVFQRITGVRSDEKNHSLGHAHGPTLRQENEKLPAAGYVKRSFRKTNNKDPAAVCPPVEPIATETRIQSRKEKARDANRKRRSQSSHGRAEFNSRSKHRREDRSDQSRLRNETKHISSSNARTDERRMKHADRNVSRVHKANRLPEANLAGHEKTHGRHHRPSRARRQRRYSTSSSDTSGYDNRRRR